MRQWVLHCLGCALGCWLAHPGTVSAQGADIVERTPELLQEFFIAESVFPQDRHELQVTVGAVYRAGNGSRVWRLPAVVEFGLSDRLQVAAELPYVSLSPVGAARARGLGNAIVSLAYGVLLNAASTAVTVGLEVELPGRRADSLLTEGRVAWQPGVVVARQIGKAQVHVGAALELSRPRSLSADVALVFPVRDLRLTTELNWLGDSDPILFFTPGLIWEAPSGLEVGAGIPMGLSADAPGTNLIVKLTYQVQL